MDHLSGMNVSDDWQLIAHASSKKNVAELKVLHPRLQLSHAAYEKIIESYERIVAPSTFSIDEKELLIDYYENPPAVLKRLIQARRSDHELDCCPYCGYPFAPDTLDHFIPKDEWPEFSFLPNNLVPQCRGCAPIKGSTYYCSDSAGCFYVHPVFSDLMSKVFIRVSIMFDDELKRPMFTAACGIIGANHAEVVRVTRHIRRMKVKSRAENYCEREFAHLKRQLKKRYFNVKNMLEVSINKKMDLEGRAIDWESALYQAIIADQHLIDYLHSFRPIQKVSAVDQPITELELD
jgi:hypothetical protein